MRTDIMKMYMYIFDKDYCQGEYSKKGHLLKFKSYMCRPVNDVRVMEKFFIC